MQVHIEAPESGSTVLARAGAVHADYMYMYPPRQTYRPLALSPAELEAKLRASFGRSDVLNLYVHVPFCRQICSFCNLYTTTGEGTDHREYTTAVLEEASRYTRFTEPKTVATLYFGGGTPSLLAPELLGAMTERLLADFSAPGTPAPSEIALEVDPATVDQARLRDLRQAGINRVNLGYQSLVPEEVTRIGRREGARRTQALEIALGTGFDNVCVDLIYGLERQTDDAWRTSVRTVAAMAPQTVCAYPLTTRPLTSYGKRGYTFVPAETLYRRYDIAHELLTAAGYRQETHVRWVRGGGGYVQKVNHWRMQNVLGLGAGARSYLWELDTRNGYSLRSRGDALHSYLRAAGTDTLPITDGYLMTDEERRRKAVVLNLLHLDRSWFTSLFGTDPVEAFPVEFACLADAGICEIGPSEIRLTAHGTRIRDLAVQMFISPEVRDRLGKFSYSE
ncbi:coproporphyrinogen dehydrogenase [Streptomyces sp. AS58]|uniref:Heme chaperone HemW n=1 Tax=Streptomyces cadmiisoli TaxID=2184053 RepID=A0A2Z4IYC3_9ACTN|nr:coproporphyrinogen III oxidase family protein [Streptomyces cadmiisoli]KOV67719.1 coproporphyrinogen dehydrogenase [Streptomyces sp. AS58]